MSDPTTTNSTVNEVNTVIKGIENICVPLIENLIIAQVPALGLPIVKQITEGIEQILANYLTKWAEEQADFIIIDGQTASEQSNLSAALKALIAAEQSKDQNAITQALSAYQAAQASLVSSDGSGNLQ